MNRDTSRKLVWSEDLELYRRKVIDSLKNFDGALIKNDGLEHANILVDEAIGVATESFCLLSSYLRSDSYDDVHTFGKFQQFCARNPDANLKIIVRDGDDLRKRGSSFVKKVIQPYPNAQLRILPADKKETAANDFFIFDSSTDKSGYRYEKDMESLTAFASFGKSDAEFVALLQSEFDKYWSISTVFEESESNDGSLESDV